tara:strand:- start:906 stop:1487 length:582 start_codon:yes stop_codon:yes gene_type:complete
MQAVKIFPDPIWRAKFPGRLDKIIKRANLYKEQKDVINNVLAGEVIQRYNLKDNPHEWEELDEFNRWFAPNMQKVWNDWDCQLDEWQELRFKSWINYSNKGNYQLEHTHPADIMTVIFYLNKPTDTASLQVQNPMMYHWNNHRQTQFWKDVNASTGDVIVIPGWMLHRVDKNLSEEERISITINATIITKEGH